MIGTDETGTEMIQVKTGSSHWAFTFSGYDGYGRVKVGAGCNYNPLVLIEDIFFKIQNGIELPVEFDNNNLDVESFTEEWA